MSRAKERLKGGNETKDSVTLLPCFYFVEVTIHLPIYLFVYLFIHPCIHPSVYLDGLLWLGVSLGSVRVRRPDSPLFCCWLWRVRTGMEGWMRPHKYDLHIFGHLARHEMHTQHRARV